MFFRKHSLTASAASLALMILMLLQCVSCAGGGGYPDLTSDPPGDTSVPDTAPPGLVIVGGADAYSIIRPSDAGEYAVKAAVTVNKALKAACPDTWENSIKEDFVSRELKGQIIENDDPEILVGYTNRKESRDAFAELEAGGDPSLYTVRTVGRKIVILGITDYATCAAADYFVDTFVAGSSGGTLSVDSSLRFDGRFDDNRPPLADGALLRLFSWNLGCSVGVAADALAVIEEYRPEVLSLQESDKTVHLNIIKPFMSKFTNYRYAKQMHTGTSTYNYTPIIYDSTKLELVEADVEWLDGRYTGTNTKSLCWAVFDTKDGRFAMINFHGAVCSAKYSGYENMTDDERAAIAAGWRLDNVRQILEVAARITAKYGEIPMTVNGDCNFTASSAPFARLTDAGFADSEATAEKKIKAGYKTSYSYASGIPGTGASIDHIFGKNGVRFLTYDVIRTPAVQTGSDHTPIYTDLALDAKK